MTNTFPILEVNNLSKVYGEGDTQIKALDSVSFGVKKDVLSQPFQRWGSEIGVMRGCWGGETAGSRTLAHDSLGW